MKLKDFPQNMRQTLKTRASPTCNFGLVLLVLYHTRGHRWQVTLVTNCPQACGCAESLRRQMASAGDPSASKPSVTGREIGALRAAGAGWTTVPSSGPFVSPVTIGLFGVLSYA